MHWDVPITKIQAAVDGSWEAALVIETDDVHTLFFRWFDGSKTEVAFEYFGQLLPNASESDFFIGYRLNALSCSITEHVDSLFRKTIMGQTTLLDILLELENTFGYALFRSDRDFCEIGQFNNWLPFVPVRFWEKGDQTSIEEALHAALEKNERYTSPTTLPTVIEIGFTSPIPHWMGFVISSAEPDGVFRLATDKAREYLRISGANL